MAGNNAYEIRLGLHFGEFDRLQGHADQHRYGQVSMIGQFVCCPVPTGLSFGKAAARRKSANAVFMAIAVLGRLLTECRSPPLRPQPHPECGFRAKHDAGSRATGSRGGAARHQPTRDVGPAYIRFRKRRAC